MKNTKRCPKCQSDNIVKIGGDAGHSMDRVAIDFIRSVPVNRYICCTCGFIEECIDKEYLEKVANSKIAKR